MAEDGVQLARGVSVASSALEWSYARSGGPGGQNVNKRSTKVVLRVGVGALGLRPGAEARLRRIAARYLTLEGELVIASDEHREQARNRDACLTRLRAVVVSALVVPKVRKKTKPSRGAVERRIREKKRRSETKSRRQGRHD
ncbi:MAG: alternative ribosome rescue aminoacyl-tRNA hydrolase ArfB [Planctomycetota bacterium]